MSIDCEHCGLTVSFGEWPFCPHGRGHGDSRIRAFHSSEKTVLYHNARTGEYRTPARNDLPVPQIYARQGYERFEIDNPQKRMDYERSSGKIHERSHYDPGSGRAEREMMSQAMPDEDVAAKTAILDGAYSELSAK